MNTSTRAADSTNGLSISEKLSLFKLKKDVAKKENEAPQINSAIPKKVGSVPIKVHLGITAAKKPADTVKVQSKATRHSLLTKSGVALKPAAEDSIISVKLVSQKGSRRDVTSKIRSRPPTAAELKGKLDEYISLAENAGNDVARSFIAAVPSEVNMKDVEIHALYWLTWIRVEGKANETDFVTELFSKAKSTVKSLSGVQAIITAEQKHLSNNKTSQSLQPGGTGAGSDTTRDLQYSMEREDQEQNSCEDVPMMLDDNSFSFSELSAPKSSNSSARNSIDSNSSSHQHDEITLQDAEGIRSDTALTILSEEKGPIQSVSKYANFLKSTQRSEVLTDHSLLQPSEIIPLAVIQPSTSNCFTETNLSVSSKVAILENRLSCISPLRSRGAVSHAASVAAELISASRVASGGLSLSKKRKSFKSPGRTNLDQLLGLGSCDNEASESEGEYFNLKKKRPAASTSCMSDRDCVIPRIDDLYAKAPDLSNSVDLNLHAVAGSKPLARSQTGSADIFSDADEEDEDDDVLPVVTEETQRVSEENKCSSSADIKTKAIPDMSPSVLTATPSAFASAALASDSMVLVPRPRGRTAVTFSDAELPGVQHTDALSDSHSQGETNIMGDALTNAELTGSYRRSSRLLRNSINSSAKKNGSDISGPTLPGSSRRVLQESLQDGKPSMDAMRNDCGYGSYFSSMEFAAQHKSQFGDDGSEFDLLAITPTKGDRRPKRQTMSTGKK